jgi:hypothetical protein
MNYRLYSFAMGHYIKEIQWGIQTAHGATQMIGRALAAHIENPVDTEVLAKCLQLADWSVPGRSNGATVIVCDVINYQGLHDVIDNMKPLADLLMMPFEIFKEDFASLGGLITNVAVLVPDALYDVIDVIDTLNPGCDAYALNPEVAKRLGEPGVTYSVGTPEHAMIKMLKSYKLVK